ncbi:hypothetical protein SAY86_003686 [Trapa natans]|uniref:Uncharacterized protein n=1 Tax=Trapa natans TaxID=22666 RepID=A0AAN7RF35_TRANT|nr:hypothetical protein SAY86_003686 [Trapa natans]
MCPDQDHQTSPSKSSTYARPRLIILSLVHIKGHFFSLKGTQGFRTSASHLLANGRNHPHHQTEPALSLLPAYQAAGLSPWTVNSGAEARQGRAMEVRPVARTGENMVHGAGQLPS